MPDVSSKKAVLQYLKDPWTKTETFPINVSRYFTDVDGVIINKALLPLPLQVKIPFYLFGEFDRVGGFVYGNNVTPVSNWVLLDQFTGGVNTPFLFAAVGNTIHIKINRGDSVLVYTDNIDVPTYYCFMIINSPNGSYVSIMQNSNYQKDGRYGIVNFKQCRYFSQNTRQYGEVIEVLNFDNLGNFVKDSFNASNYLTPEYNETLSVLMPMEFKLHPLVEFTSYLLFAVDEINFSFQLNLK